MLFKNFGQIILIIASVTAGNVLQDCIYFKGDSGFIQLAPQALNKNPVISMEVKAYNCDDISFTFYNRKNYKLTLPIEGNFLRDDGEISNFKISGPCNGLWHKVTLILDDESSYFKFDNSTTYPSLDDIKGFVKSFDGESLYLGIHTYKGMEEKKDDDDDDDDYYVDENESKYKTYDKPFEGFIRNVTLDGRFQSIDQSSLNGTLVTKSCPKDLIFTSAEGSAQLSESVTFNTQNMRIYFEVKIPDCPECCNSSAILLSAIGDDSYVIIEIIKNKMSVKMKSGSKTFENIMYVFSIDNYCDGNWHKIALLQKDRDIIMITDNYSDKTNIGTISLNFSAPVYIGQHPKPLEAFEIRKGFKGCLRSLQVSGVVPEIIENNVNEFTKIGTCGENE